MTNRWLILVICLSFFLTYYSTSAFSNDPQNPPIGTLENPTVKKDEKDITDNDLIQAIRTANRPMPDVRMQIVKKIAEVRQGKLSAEDFYKQVSALEMPGGKEVRHVLMEVKKDIGNYLGENGLRAVFGELYSSGGSKAESIILSHRKNVVQETIQQVIKNFAGTEQKFSVYYSEVGGWPGETPEQMKFAGDIDFNFLCGDLETAMKLKKTYDDYIYKRYGRTPEDLDIPCTVHGMATGEVYVGKKGQSFAEGVTKTAKRINFGEDGKAPGFEKTVEFKDALGTMLAEAKISKTPLANLDELKWPTEPGISLEMIRHFEHDIVKQNVYTDLESFVKAAKYTDRSFTALENDLGQDAIKDMDLRALTAELVAQKKSPIKQIELIKQFYTMSNRPMPFEADLTVSPDGHAKATLKINEQLVKEFWDECRKTMWESANTKLKKVISDFEQKSKSLRNADPQDVKLMYDELNKYNEMLEIEDRILTDGKAGVHEKLNNEYVKLIERFRNVVGEFKKNAAKYDHLKVIDPTKGNTYKFIDEQLKLDNEVSIRLAAVAATLAEAPGKLNDMLDFMDDGLLNTLRYGETKDFEDFLGKQKEVHWGKQADQFLKGTRWEGQYTQRIAETEISIKEKINARVDQASKFLTNKLGEKCTSRGIKLITSAGGAVAGGIQRINNTFNQSVSGSRGGQAMMQGMMIYNLSQEVPIYIEYFANEDYEGLATEFFKRRVPFGSAVEAGVMGDYYGVAWEVTATLLPPAAIFSAAKSIGESLGQSAWDSFWDEELETFIDDLYENAKFKIVSVETTGDDIKISQWALLSVTYQGKTYDFHELLQQEISDAQEMAACLQKPSAQRPACFPMEKFRNGLFEWMRADDAFRTNLRKSDPWIQLIEEMENAPHVGEKLEDHFQYQKYTRWEQIKVEFLQKIKKKLEDRRAGEQALLSGAIPKMYDELLAIARKLDIEPQIIRNLEEQLGGEFIQFLTSLKDYLRGTIRELRGDADVWDVYEQNAEVITEYLRTYKRIWDGRAFAEQNLPVARQDQGLRILTGPYFMEGVSENDAPNAKKWMEYPSAAFQKFSQTLQDIKTEAQAVPLELDLNESAFDKGILDQLIFHDTFREAWKQVNSRQISTEIPSYLGKETAEQKYPNEEGGQSDQDRALERFKFHEAETKRLINEFRAHYGLKEKDQLSELRELRDRAVALASEICAECSAATAQMDTITATIDAASESFVEFENSIKDAIDEAKNIENIEGELTSLHETAEGLAVHIGDENVIAGENRETVCQIANAMQNCKTNSERDQLYSEATAAHAVIKPAFERSRADFQKLEGIGNTAKEKSEKLSKAQQLANSIKNIPKNIATAKNDVNASIQSIENTLTANADAKLQQIKDIISTSKTVYANTKETLKPIRKTPEGETLWNEMGVIMDEISAQDNVAQGCIKGPKGRLKSEKTKADNFINRYTALETNLNRIRAVFLNDADGNPNPKFASAMEKINLIDLLVSMGKGYIESCTEHLLMAKVCMNAADQLSIVDFSAFMPNIIGMSCQDGAGAVASNKIDYQIVSKGQATHPDWEYRVESTDPAGGVEVTLAETTAIIACFEDLNIPAYLATIDCRHIPGSTAVYDQGQRRGVCDCINGVIFNPSRTRCINCNEYYQGFLNAFNAGDLDSAQAWITEAQGCPWTPQAQGQVNAERQRQACIQIAMNMQAACQQNNAQWASALQAEANNWQCPIDPGLWQLTNNVINTHNEWVRQEQIRQQQIQQQNAQEMMNIMTDMFNGLNNIRSQSHQSSGGYNSGTTPTQTPATTSNSTSSGSSGGSGGSSGSGGGDPCAGCRGLCLLGVCQD